MSTHAGSVRSFDLGGAGTAGRRWSARCKCGALATTGAWHEALTFLTEHLRVTAKPPAAWQARHPTPDLRRAQCWRPVAVSLNGSTRTQPQSVAGQPVVRALSSLVRVVLGALRMSLSN